MGDGIGINNLFLRIKIIKILLLHRMFHKHHTIDQRLKSLDLLLNVGYFASIASKFGILYVPLGIGIQLNNFPPFGGFKTEEMT